MQVFIFDLVIRVFAQSTFAMLETKVFVLESVAIMGETVSEMNMNPTNSLLDVENVHPQSSSSLSLESDDVQVELIKV